MRTLTLEGDITTVDTRVTLTGQGSVTAPSLVTPADVTKITTVVAAIAAEGLVAGASTYILRIGGNAVKNGEQTLLVSASGTALPQAGADVAPQQMMSIVLENLDIEVGPSDTVSVSVEMAGSDNGTARAAVTLIFA